MIDSFLTILDLQAPEVRLAILLFSFVLTGVAFYFIAELGKSIAQHNQHRQVQRDLSDHALREYDRKQREKATLHVAEWKGR